jgi:high-affinity iron transporter
MTTSTAVHHQPLTGRPTTWRGVASGLALLAVLPIVVLLIWQGVTSHGSPDPTVPQTSHFSAILDISVLVFREGLETILVLAAITAGLSRKSENRSFATPIFTGAACGILASIVTWYIVRGIVSDLTTVVPALALQAATGLLAVVVLLIVMNWFFHKVYWGGWISLHNRRKRELMGSTAARTSPLLIFWGLVLLGLSSVYREGFEVVLFLQSYYLKLGHGTVLAGSLVGCFLTAVMAALTFWAHTKLPYRKMLILTGILLGVVLLVMVGEEAQEMQLAGWLSTTNIPALSWIPDWAGVWFSIFPNVETIAAQAVAAVLVVGSYFLSGRIMGSHSAEETVG